MSLKVETPDPESWPTTRRYPRTAFEAFGDFRYMSKPPRPVSASRVLKNAGLLFFAVLLVVLAWVW